MRQPNRIRGSHLVVTFAFLLAVAIAALVTIPAAQRVQQDATHTAARAAQIREQAALALQLGRADAGATERSKALLRQIPTAAALPDVLAAVKNAVGKSGASWKRTDARQGGDIRASNVTLHTYELTVAMTATGAQVSAFVKLVSALPRLVTVTRVTTNGADPADVQITVRVYTAGDFR